jgi:hypothetical protein
MSAQGRRADSVARTSHSQAVIGVKPPKVVDGYQSARALVAAAVDFLGDPTVTIVKWPPIEAFRRKSMIVRWKFVDDQ